MSTFLWIAAAYVVIGFLLTVFGPFRRDINTEILIMTATNPDAPQWKVAVLKFVVLSGVVFLWAFFLPGVLRQNAQKNLDIGHDPVTATDGLADGKLRFDRMGGAGKILCADCGYATDLTSFTHGSVGSSTGYQCQICGKFTSRDYEQPFADSSDYAWLECPILELDPEYRPSTIEHEQLLIHMIERQMETLPKEEWMETWESDLAKYRERLSHVPEEELARIKRVRDEVNSKYEASLFCECGGPLDREKVLFCPGCRSTNLSYDMKYIT